MLADPPHTKSASVLCFLVGEGSCRFRLVRDPSIVSPSLTGVFIGGGHNKHGRYRIEVHAAEAVSSPLSPTAMAV